MFSGMYLDGVDERYASENSSNIRATASDYSRDIDSIVGKSRSLSRKYDVGEPTDPAVYALVAERQGRNLLDELPPEAEFDEEFTPPELALRQDFLKQKAQWHNNWRKDWWEFNRNFNPLLTLCYVHPLHPITRTERIVVYCVQLLLMLFISSFMALGEVCTACDITCGKGRAYEPIFNSTGQMVDSCAPEELANDPDFCCNSYGIASARWFLQQSWVITIFGQEYYLAGAIYPMIVNVIFALASFQLMLCGCVQNLHWKKRVLWQYVGYAVFALIGISIVVRGIPMLIYSIHQNKVTSMVLNFVISKLTTSVGMALWGTFLFHVLWKLQTPGRSVEPMDEDEEDLDDQPEGGCCGGLIRPPVRSPTGDDPRSTLSRMASPLFHVTCQEFCELAGRDSASTLRLLQA